MKEVKEIQLEINNVNYNIFFIKIYMDGSSVLAFPTMIDEALCNLIAFYFNYLFEKKYKGRLLSASIAHEIKYDMTWFVNNNLLKINGNTPEILVDIYED